ncbi:MAG: ferritin-like domain-containing protein [Chloroflexi bacterium]|nr:ferritin-like domain-containing protein [Chloroflexota bacterium]
MATQTLARETRDAARTGGVVPSREQLIRLLNGDLSREYQAAVMYVTYAALVAGPFRPQLAAFFKREVPDELAHAQFLADKIAALGGTPTTELAAVYCPHRS